MPKIHSKQPSPKINKAQISENQGCSSDQHPFFSFRFMTTNKVHSLSFLDSMRGPARELTLRSLYEKLEAISQRPWVYWAQERKKSGLETIKYEQLRFEPSTDVTLTKDTTLYVFRFDTYQGTGKGRIIGFKGSPCSALHIIGYDFDFSAYPHG